MNEWVNAIGKSLETFYAAIKADIPVEFSYKNKKIMENLNSANSPR